MERQAPARAHHRLRNLLVALAVLGLVAAACGDDSGSSEEAATTTEASTTTTTSEPGGEEATTDREEAISGFEDEVREGIGLGAGGSTGEGSGDADAETYASYTTVSDDSGVLTVQVPTEWSDVDGSEGLFGPDVIASVSVAGFLESFDVPGVEFQATTLGDQVPQDALDALASGFVTACEAGPVEPYADPLYSGVSQLYRRCGGGTSGFAWVAVQPEDRRFTAVVGVQIVSERDIEALGVVLDTFVVNA